MAAFNKFSSWVDYMVEGANLATDQFAVALTNTAPVAGNSVIADISQIAYTNLSSRALTTLSASQTGGSFALVLDDLVLTASGSVDPFRYVVLLDDTLAGKPVVGWWDHGSSITMASGDTYIIDFTGNAITLS